MTLTELNSLPTSRLKETLATCCGSAVWVNRMCGIFPVSGLDQLQEEASRIWFACSEHDWLEAFDHHPKIGDIKSLEKKFAATAGWAAGEQAAVNHTSQDILQALAQGNAAYETKFGFIFIVCATGKSAGEMLNLLQERLLNTKQDELTIAMKEQDKITRLRLQKLISS